MGLAWGPREGAGDRAVARVSGLSPSFRQPLIPNGCHLFLFSTRQAEGPAQELMVNGAMIPSRVLVNMAMEVQAGCTGEKRGCLGKVFFRAWLWTRYWSL